MTADHATDGDDGVGEVEECADDIFPALVAALHAVGAYYSACGTGRTPRAASRGPGPGRRRIPQARHVPVGHRPGVRATEPGSVLLDRAQLGRAAYGQAAPVHGQIRGS